MTEAISVQLEYTHASSIGLEADAVRRAAFKLEFSLPSAPSNTSLRLYTSHTVQNGGSHCLFPIFRRDNPAFEATLWIFFQREGNHDLSFQLEFHNPSFHKPKFSIDIKASFRSSSLGSSSSALN